MSQSQNKEKIESKSLSAARFVCEYCKKEFGDRSRLKQHKKIHLYKTDFKCPRCQYVTNVKKNLRSHIRTHTKERPFKCPEPQCDSAFAQARNLKIHQLRVHLSKEDKTLYTFKCPTCPFKSVIKWSLTEHMKIHAKVKEFSCDLCPYKAKLKSYIRGHVKRIHSTTAKSFHCPYPGCQYFCHLAQYLTQHLTTHRDERPFVCPFQQCGFKTRWKTNLYRHKQNHEMGEKPLFRCTLGNDNSVNNEDNLAVHREDHQGSLDHDQRPNCCANGERSDKIPGDWMSQVTHVQWSVDWGRIQTRSRVLGSGEVQRPKLPRTVIKVENDTS